MKLKLDADGHVVVQDGKPVYVHDDGKEIAFDAAGTATTISRLNGEAKSHRERAEAAEAKIKLFDGIEDPAAAIKALATVKNLDDKRLIDAGEVETIKAGMAKAYDEKLAAAEAATQKLQQQLHQELVGGAFARSKLVTEKLAIPSDMVQSFFGSAFKVEDGKVVAYGHDGQKLLSRARPGDLATFDEALETLVDAYPHRDSILKGTGASGGGAASNSGSNGGKKTLSRAQFNQLDPAAQSAAARDANTVITE